jgi:hypothetical protein
MPPERSALAGRRGSGLGGQQARPGRRGRTHLALRLARGGLLIAAGAIHLDLYLTGYRSIPTIGWLFLLQVITAFGLGAVVLVPAGSLTAAASAVLAAGRGTGDRGPWCHRQARDDHALGWLGSGHLRRASAVHLRRRRCSRASQRQRAQPERRTVA